MRTASVDTYGFVNGSWMLVRVMVSVSPGLPSLTIAGARQAQVAGLGKRMRTVLATVFALTKPRRVQAELQPSCSWHSGMELALTIACVKAQGGTLQSWASLPLLGQITATGGVASAPCCAAVVQSASQLVVSTECCALASCGVDILCISHVAKTTQKPGAFVAPSRTRQALAGLSGLQQSKRLLAIAAVGGHSLFLAGPPGVGKSVLATAYQELLPAYLPPEALAAAAYFGSMLPIYYPVSRVMSAGSQSPQWHAHRYGVLVCDELPLWSEQYRLRLRQVLDAAADPSRHTHVIATGNPCRCGYRGTAHCTCTPAALAAFDARIPLPLRDRFALYAWVHADFSAAQLSSADDADALAVQVENARSRPCECPQEAEAMLHTVTTALRLSPRSAQLVRAVAMSIARLDGCSLVTAAHIEESASYRFRNLA